MNSKQPLVSIFWFRRDLRLSDNHGLHKTLEGPNPVLPIFVFDKHILEDLEDKKDARVEFIHREISEIHHQLQQTKGGVLTFYGTPETVFQDLLAKINIASVYANHDYEPYAIKRDQKIKNLLQGHGIEFHTFKDQVIFEREEILSGSGEPYRVFTPYKEKWLQKLASKASERYTTSWQTATFFPTNTPIISLKELGFQSSSIPIPDKAVAEDLIRDYDKTRDKPHLETSRIGVHLRFGTVSIRELVNIARSVNKVFLSELIWREFFMMILYHRPGVVDHAFNSKYDDIRWRNDEGDFEKWCKGMTGYPIVDAGMRQLNATGFMHNRVRMIVASFLTKHLLIDWRWGEAYFAKKLLDYELASNNGNWQWVAGTGADAQPYFRIFNPMTQMAKFDKEGKYVKQWLPEWGTDKYLSPMVDHKEARERALKVFQAAASGSS